MSSHEIPANDSLDSEAVFSPLSDLSFEDRKYLDINPGFDLKLVPRWEGVISEIQKISDLKVRHGFYRRDASYNQFILDVSFNGGFRLIVFEKTRHAVESVAPEKIAKEGSNWMLFDNRNTH